MRFKRLLSAAVGVSLVFALFPLIPRQALADDVREETELPRVDNEVLVIYEDDFQSDGISLFSDDALADVDIVSEEIITESFEEIGTVAKLTLEDDEDVDEVVAKLNDAPGVAFAQPNFVYELMEDVDTLVTPEMPLHDSDSGASLMATNPTNDPSISQQYYLYDWAGSKGANVTKAWETRKTNKAVTVAILDSGINPTHVDLAANIDTANMADVSSGKAVNIGTLNDPVGHGTHVAGIVSGVANNGVGIAGSSYNATILPIKVTYYTGGAYKADSTTLLAGYNYLKSLITSGKLTNLHVVNMSLGSYGTSNSDILMERAITEFKNTYRVLSVCAGGNGDSKTPDTRKIFPGDYDDCLCVTALTTKGTNVVWSDYNMYKDISAPGESLYSTYSTSNTAYRAQSGTSMASPLVAGIAALLWAEDPSLSVSRAVQAITSTAKKLDPAGANYRSPSQTGSVGAIDAAAALAVVKASKPVEKINISKATVTVTDSLAYTGGNLTPDPKVTYQGKTLVKNVDYTVRYQNNINGGKATITITGIGAYTGTTTTTFSIYYSLTSKTVTFNAIAEQEYTGKALTPTVTAYYKNPYTGQSTLLKLNTDYTVTYSNNINASTSATVKITGKGNYKGDAQTTFTIKKVDTTLTFPTVKYTGKVTSYRDVTTKHWIQNEPSGQPGLYLAYVSNNEIMAGYTSTNFGVDEYITRGQIATILYRLAKASGKIDESNLKKMPFSDVASNSYYATAIRWCYSMGIINGYGDGKTFGPNNKVTREQLCKMIASFVTYAKKIDTGNATASSLSRFSDSTRISSWARASVAWCVNKSLLGGTSILGRTMLYPQNNATRGQVAKIITNMVRAVQ